MSPENGARVWRIEEEFSEQKGTERENIPSGWMRIYLVRHGQQLDPDDENSPLSPLGISQCHNFRKFLTGQLIDATARASVKLIESGKRRNRQSAEIILSGLTNDLSSNPNIVVYPKIETMAILNTTGALTELGKIGVEISERYNTWAAMNEEDLIAKGLKTKIQTARPIINFILNMDLAINRLLQSKAVSDLWHVGTTAKMYQVWISHETGLGAIHLWVDPNQDVPPIQHMEPIIVDVGTGNGQIKFSFPGGTSKQIPSVFERQALFTP